jgi:ABC-type ATPase involved in cell division
MILFSDVSKKVDNEVYLKNISFKINRSEFVIIYDNHQKSLNVLCDLLYENKEPSDGLIRIMNRYEKKSSLFDREIGVVYRENILLPGRSIEQNYRFIMNVMGENRKYHRIRSKKILEIIGLSGDEDLLPSELLPHQLVRANIGQSLLFHPSIVIINDTTAKLDEVNSRAIFHLVEDINSLGITIVFLSSDKKLISHNKIRRVIYLKEGKILAENNKGYYG